MPAPRSTQGQLLIIAVFPLTKLWQDVRYGAEEESEEISSGKGSEGIGARESGFTAPGESGPREEQEDGKAQANAEEALGRIQRLSLTWRLGHRMVN
jgi:hypothetical protein